MTEGPILFFDGICNLCNSAVQFVISHDKRGTIRFASLQSAAGQAAKAAVLAKMGRIPDALILLEHGQYYTESDAALRVAAHLNGAWKSLSHLQVFPRLLRNSIYRLVARYRYSLFGKRDACMLPSAALRQRFLD